MHWQETEDWPAWTCRHCGHRNRGTDNSLLCESLSEQMAAVEREIAMRERVYPRRIADGKMPAAKADRELAAMRAVLGTLRGVQALERECGVGLPRA